jgi:hypothetical protein
LGKPRSQWPRTPGCSPLFQRRAAALGDEERGRDDVDHVDGGEQRDRRLERIGGDQRADDQRSEAADPAPDAMFGCTVVMIAPGYARSSASSQYSKPPRL